MKKLLILLMLPSCASMPESNFELDRRSGMRPPGDASTDVIETLRSERNLTQTPKMPARVEPLIEKIWVYDQILEGGHWLSGTWMFVEIERSRWLPELDTGAAPLIKEESK